MDNYYSLEERRKNNKKVISVLLFFFTITIIVLILSLKPSRGNNGGDSGSLSNEFISALSEKATFPNGSYRVNVNQFGEADNSLAPLPVNASVLSLFGISVDPSSYIIEAGRLSYIWMILSNTTFQPFNDSRILSGTGGMLSEKRVSGIGIRFGDSTAMTVIPLSLATVSGSGVHIVTTFADGSSLLQIGMGAPSSLCSVVSSNTQTCTPISYSSYAVTPNQKIATIQNSQAGSSSLPVSCGSQCSSSVGTQCSLSCNVCSNQQVAGADTPVSRRFDLGETQSSFKFSYETYTIKDRITVWYGEQQLFDSGCVGTGGERKTTLSYSGSTSEIRVDVEPNCECQSITGCTGTQWYFNVDCPCPSNGPKASLVSNGNDVKNNQVLIITDTPAMPPLLAIYKCSEAITWKFEIQYQSWKESFEGTSSNWDIGNAMHGRVLGGNAVLSWKAGSDTGSISFTIQATQPQDSTILATIGTNPWYAPYVAKHESILKQFVNGMPLKSVDNGYGIFQLTNPVPSYDQVWNWKENVKEGLNILRAKASQANTWMNGANGQRIQARQQMGHDVPINHSESNCAFVDGSGRVAEDAVALKMFNGASGGNYVSWDNGNGVWKYNPLNSLGFNYVKRVCDLVP